MPNKDFDYTGDWQHWEVPKKVEWVEVTVTGAGSNDEPGGRVTGRINVKQVNSLWVSVGQHGKPNTGSTGGVETWGGGGAGGNGRGFPGGWSGGGASVIRSNSKTGSVKAVAAGAGGTSGDSGLGGKGGADVGEAGCPGNLVGWDDSVVWDHQPCRPVLGEAVGPASGGTQIQSGNGGTSSGGLDLSGGSPGDGVLDRGGRGGQSSTVDTCGGGGGGGGYHPGGGGQAGLLNDTFGAPAGGGGGGANYRGGLTSYTSSQGGGATGHGSVSLSWVTPAPANQPPSPPTEIKVNGEDEVEDMVTHSRGTVKISAKLNDPDHKQKVRMLVQYTPSSDFSNPQLARSDLIDQDGQEPKGKKHKDHGRAVVELNSLSQNTLWHARLYTRDAAGLLSINYATVTFWTNRAPTEPMLMSPSENAEVFVSASVPFSWSHQDPDDPESPIQQAFRLRYRRASTPATKAGEWTQVEYVTYDETWVSDPDTFKSNNFYEWQVKTQDPQNAWGPWSAARSFFVEGTTAPPILISPVNGEAVVVDDPVTLCWTFRDPSADATQYSADVRYRPVGTGPWFEQIGNFVIPGSDDRWALLPDTLIAGLRYEWQVRTYSTITSPPSQWSESETFYSIHTPGFDLTEAVVPSVVSIQGELGCGTHRVFIYDRGGQRLRGEVTPIARIVYGRKRDDISNCIVDTSGFGDDCCALLADVRSWLHELVVFRDGKRVWEGPITRVTYMRDAVEIEAKDVLAYLYRRILRQGYNDTYRFVNGVQVGQTTVVQRARRIAMNALAPDDPNLLGYLTSLDYPDDAKQSRVVQDWTKTAWEDIDDMAANAGLDYTAVGRRILFWDTHRPIGRLPEWRDENFNDPPVITEYGMLLATGFGVTNNAGIYGYSDRNNIPYPDNPYGIVEQLASAYGETEDTGAVDEALTREGRERLEETLNTQAERSIAKRWPTPLVVRVPDNSMLTPDTPVPFEFLVPGVWIPLRARSTCRELAQWQKLDFVNVEETPEGERVTVTLSPAPNYGDDPDAEQIIGGE